MFLSSTDSTADCHDFDNTARNCISKVDNRCTIDRLIKTTFSIDLANSFYTGLIDRIRPNRVDRNFTSAGAYFDVDTICLLMDTLDILIIERKSIHKCVINRFPREVKFAAVR